MPRKGYLTGATNRRLHVRPALKEVKWAALFWKSGYVDNARQRAAAEWSPGVFVAYISLTPTSLGVLLE